MIPARDWMCIFSPASAARSACSRKSLLNWDSSGIFRDTKGFSRMVAKKMLHTRRICFWKRPLADRSRRTLTTSAPQITERAYCLMASNYVAPFRKHTVPIIFRAHMVPIIPSSSPMAVEKSSVSSERRLLPTMPQRAAIPFVTR